MFIICCSEWSSIADQGRAFEIRIYSKLSVDSLPLWSRFWANHSNARLRQNHAPVHQTHSAKVIQMTWQNHAPVHKTHSAKVIQMTWQNHAPVHKTHSAKVIQMTWQNHAPIHKTHSAKVIQMTTNFVRRSPTRI
jgi:hypothetical protein